MVGDLPDPYYWWQAGALWGAMLDYYHYTGDPTYNHVVLEALLAPANTGPKHDFNPPEHYLELGNDDLSFWGFAVLSAAERNFPQPKPELPSWLDMGQNIFRTLSSRWNTTHCGGGVLWQVFESNPNGLNYKNSVTNGGLFQLAARLARATGEATYTDWTTRAWDWSTATGLIGKKLNVYDGAHASDDCAQVNYVAFTYTAGIYLYGAAIMAEITGDQIWADRAHGILKAAGHFFGHSDASKDIMYEPACEPNDKCNHDMKVSIPYPATHHAFMTDLCSLSKHISPVSCGSPPITYRPSPPRSRGFSRPRLWRRPRRALAGPTGPLADRNGMLEASTTPSASGSRCALSRRSRGCSSTRRRRLSKPAASRQSETRLGLRGPIDGKSRKKVHIHLHDNDDEIIEADSHPRSSQGRYTKSG